MGTYGLSGEEIKDKFRKFLIDTSSGEGDIGAETIAEAWNMIAEDEEWGDRLKSFAISGSDE